MKIKKQKAQNGKFCNNLNFKIIDNVFKQLNVKTRYAIQRKILNKVMLKNIKKNY